MQIRKTTQEHRRPGSNLGQVIRLMPSPSLTLFPEGVCYCLLSNKGKKAQKYYWKKKIFWLLTECLLSSATLIMRLTSNPSFRGHMNAPSITFKSTDMLLQKHQKITSNGDSTRNNWIGLDSRQTVGVCWHLNSALHLGKSPFVTCSLLFSFCLGQKRALSAGVSNPELDVPEMISGDPRLVPALIILSSWYLLSHCTWSLKSGNLWFLQITANDLCLFSHLTRRVWGLQQWLSTHLNTRRTCKLHKLLVLEAGNC